MKKNTKKVKVNPEEEMKRRERVWEAMRIAASQSMDNK